MKVLAAAVALAVVPAVLARPARSGQRFVPPSNSPFEQSSNYDGANNATFPKPDLVSGKAFDRIIQIWYENTNFDVAASTHAFQKLRKEDLIFTNYFGLTHLSQPNYLGSVAGDFFGMGDDDFFHLPSNISTVFDLLTDGGQAGSPISFACYMENLPYDGYTGSVHYSHNYLDPDADDYPFYVRKHNPCALSDTISGNRKLATKVNRNFNDLAADIQADALPQWMFITPNMANDGHNTGANYFSDFTEYFLFPLLKSSNFNSERTLIILTFDENEDSSIGNNVFNIALGNAVPSNLKNTEDSTYLTHYSLLSTVQANWGLKNLGRGDVDKVMSNVLPFVADATGHHNHHVHNDDRPDTNIQGQFPGPFNSHHWLPFWAPKDVSVIGAGGLAVLVKDGLDTSVTHDTLPDPIRIELEDNPYHQDPGFDNSP